MPLVSQSEYEFRYISSKMWLKIIGLLLPAAFFFGAEFGKWDTAAQHRGLIAQMPSSCKMSYEAIVLHEMPR